MKPVFEKLFGFDSARHSIKTEILAGITTFLTMAYILAVNPNIFSALEGMPGGAVFTATALAALIGTLVMALYAKKPFALAPGMGLNAFFVYTVCLGMGYTWQFALTAVLLEGLLFIILTLTKVRTWLLNAIPGTLKKAIGAGIGLFIAFIGLQNAGIIVNSDATLVTLGTITKGKALVGIIGLIITAGLVMAKVRGGMLWGILITAVIGLFIKDPATGEAVTQLLRNESGSVRLLSLPDSVSPIFCKFEWGHILSWDMLVVVFTFLFIDMFDTMGTIIGVHQGAGLVDENARRHGKDVPGRLRRHRLRCLSWHLHHYDLCRKRFRRRRRRTYRFDGVLYGHLLHPGPVLQSHLPGDSRRRYSARPGNRGRDDDAFRQAHPLGRLLQSHPRLPHHHPDAAVLLYQ